MRLIANGLGRQLAEENGEDTEGWDEEAFTEYLFEAADWRSVFRVTWKGGSVAGVEEWRGMFHAFDDVEIHGPYTSFEEARSKLRIDSGTDEVTERWVLPQFAEFDSD